MSKRTALVTGGNRGLGLETCRQLGLLGMRVVLTSRSAGGRDAVGTLRRDGLDAVHEVLDVTDDPSALSLVERLSARGEVLDVIVNNAGMSMKGFDARVAKETTDANYAGAERVTEVLLPLLRDGGAIVMVSSGMGELSAFAPALRERFLEPSLDRPGLRALVNEFVQAVADGHHEADGWPSSGYRVSKAAMNALTRIFARELAPRRVLVNAVCPGWVKTDMGGPHASRSVEDGSRGIVWAATLPPGGPTGGFFRDSLRIEW
jgi:NAD(P)-dependent dehydrogenase (short-subunit alcohol dehydrogenase family)